MPDLHRVHDVSGLTSGDLERARRELTASLALVRPGSPVRVPILAQMSAIDTEPPSPSKRPQHRRQAGFVSAGVGVVSAAGPGAGDRLVIGAAGRGAVGPGGPGRLFPVAWPGAGQPAGHSAVLVLVRVCRHGVPVVTGVHGGARAPGARARARVARPMTGLRQAASRPSAGQCHLVARMTAAITNPKPTTRFHAPRAESPGTDPPAR